MTSAVPGSVLVVEDDYETRMYLSEAIEGDDARYAVTSAGTLEEGLRRLVDECPEVVLVDLGLPDGTGLDLIRRAREMAHGPLPLVITVFGDEQSVIRALEAGARGYLLKSEAPEDMRNAVDQIREGGAPISPGIASHLLRRFAPPELQPLVEDDPTHLTGRERAVLDLVVRGYSNHEAAAALNITRNTIATHIKNIYRKLEVQSRSQVVVEAVRRGLVKIAHSD